MKIGVEIEPPKGAYTTQKEEKHSFEEEVNAYKNHVSMISITNRPVFGLSSITMAKRVQRLSMDANREIRINLHLTTRYSHFDIYREVLDSHRIGLTDLLPILGDPRGPKNDKTYFVDGFEILGFVNYLRNGNAEYLSDRFTEMIERGEFIEPLDDTKFRVGSVVDLNPYKEIKGKQIEIREKQIKFALRKQELGADYLISQGIFDTEHYFSFLEESGLKIPIIPGVLPARLRLINAFGIPINTLLKSRLRAQFSTEDEQREGNKISRDVFNDLKEKGCEAVHVYSLGSLKNFEEITGLKVGLPKIKLYDKSKDLGKS